MNTASSARKCTALPWVEPTHFDMIDALDQWVDQGKAPERIIASHSNNGAVDRTRPLCPYPLEAQWKGSGSTDDEQNFVCALPAGE